MLMDLCSVPVGCVAQAIWGHGEKSWQTIVCSSYPRSYFKTKDNGKQVTGTVARSNYHKVTSSGDAAEHLLDFAHQNMRLTLVRVVKCLQMIRYALIVAAHNSEYCWLDPRRAAWWYDGIESRETWKSSWTASRESRRLWRGWRRGARGRCLMGQRSWLVTLKRELV